MLAFVSINLGYAQQEPFSSNGMDAGTIPATAQNVVVNQTGKILVQKGNTNKVSTVVQQMGSTNNAAANIQAFTGRVGLNQFGYNNDINVNLSAGLVNEDVFQIGQNNKLITNNTQPVLYQNTKVVQRGSNQNLVMQGANKMSRNMMVNMSGREQTIIIRNLR